MKIKSLLLAATIGAACLLAPKAQAQVDDRSSYTTFINVLFPPAYPENNWIRSMLIPDYTKGNIFPPDVTQFFVGMTSSNNYVMVDQNGGVWLTGQIPGDYDPLDAAAAQAAGEDDEGDIGSIMAKFNLMPAGQSEY